MKTDISPSLWRFINLLHDAVEGKDEYTVAHQISVSSLAKAIGRSMSLTQNEIDCLDTCGLLHDVGKVVVPDEILLKPGKLTKDEYTVIKEHANAGREMLDFISFPWDVAEICGQHHERLNGSGYPNGLSSDSILFEAKIIAVADVVHSMMLPRPYRDGLGEELALNEIEKNASELYDKEVVEHCLKIFREGLINPQSKYFTGKR